jgi:hypothetical protein
MKFLSGCVVIFVVVTAVAEAKDWWDEETSNKSIRSFKDSDGFDNSINPNLPSVYSLKILVMVLVT